MRRLFLSAMLALFAASAGAQSQGQCFFCYWPPAGTGGTWDGGAFTTPATGPTGCTNPAFSFIGDTTAGFCRVGAASVRMQSAASGARGTAGTSSTQADIGFNDAGSAFTGFTFADDQVIFYASSVAKFQLGASPGTGLFTLRGGSTDAIARSIAAGTGASVSNGDGQSGNPTVGVDTATTPQFSSGTGDVPATGGVGTFYSETDANSFYTYPSTNTEHWLLSIAAGTAQGDVFYSSAADVLSSLAKDTNATRYLSNTGASNNPAWAQVNLTNGVTGDLPLSNVAQASGASVLLCRGSAGGAGDFQECTLGTNLSMSGTTLSASGGSATFDRTKFERVEEFTTGGASSGDIGEYGLVFSAYNSGTQTAENTTAGPGIRRIASTTSDNSGGNLGWRSSSGATIHEGVWSATNVIWEIEARVITPAAITSFALSMLIGQGAAGGVLQENQAIGIRFDTDVSDTSWGYIICDSSTTGCGSAGDDTNQNYVDSGSAVSTSTAYILKIRQDWTGPGSSKKLTFTVNGAASKTMCSSGCDDTLSNLPSVAYNFDVACATRAASTTRTCDVDYMRIYFENLSR